MGGICSCCFEDGEGSGDNGVLKPLLQSVGQSRSFEAVQEVKGAPIGKKWYHGGISDDEAEFRLKSVARDNGDYLVYDSNQLVGRRGEYVLLVFFEGKCHRWKISRRRDGMYVLGKDGPGVKSYESVRELIKHHRGLVNSKPLKLEYGGTVKLANYAYVPENTGRSRWNGN